MASFFEALLEDLGEEVFEFATGGGFYEPGFEVAQVDVKPALASDSLGGWLGGMLVAAKGMLLVGLCHE